MIVRLTPTEWKGLAENAHVAMFSKSRPASMDRIDYVLVVDVDGVLGGYITVRELDAETVYWQFGGAFEWARKQSIVIREYDELLLAQKVLARRIVTKVENTNTSTLKLHLSRGFLIIGTEFWDGKTLVVLKKELSNGDGQNFRQHAEPEASHQEAG